MDTAKAPQWLLPAFVRAAKSAGATAPKEQIEQTGRDLIQRWSDPSRHFYSLWHVSEVLSRIDELSGCTHHADLVRVAAWYHGSVNDEGSHRPGECMGKPDDTSSTIFARQSLAELGIPEQRIARLCELINAASALCCDPGDVDAQTLVDANLAILAVSPQRYKEYRDSVRQEFSDIPDEKYLHSRLMAVRFLLSRRRLFLSPMGKQWESAARENLQAEKLRLEAELTKLGYPVTADFSAQSASERESGQAERKSGAKNSCVVVIKSRKDTATTNSVLAAEPAVSLLDKAQTAIHEPAEHIAEATDSPFAGLAPLDTRSGALPVRSTRIATPEADATSNDTPDFSHRVPLVPGMTTAAVADPDPAKPQATLSQEEINAANAAAAKAASAAAVQKAASIAMAGRGTTPAAGISIAREPEPPVDYGAVSTLETSDDVFAGYYQRAGADTPKATVKIVGKPNAAAYKPENNGNGDEEPYIVQF